MKIKLSTLHKRLILVKQNVMLKGSSSRGLMGKARATPRSAYHPLPGKASPSVRRQSRTRATQGPKISLQTNCIPGTTRRIASFSRTHLRTKHKTTFTVRTTPSPQRRSSITDSCPLHCHRLIRDTRYINCVYADHDCSHPKVPPRRRAFSVQHLSLRCVSSAGANSTWPSTLTGPL